MTTDPGVSPNRVDWHKPQIRWHLKAYGWRQITLTVPVIWRWCFFVTLRLFPESNWLIGASFGNASYDDDPYLLLSVGFAFVEVNPMRIYTRKEQIAMRNHV